jgi:hypothetical protein
MLEPTATSFNVTEFYDLDNNGHRTEPLFLRLFVKELAIQLRQIILPFLEQMTPGKENLWVGCNCY